MDALFERHVEYLAEVPQEFERQLMREIDWNSRLIIIRGPKGVGKSTLMQQYLLRHYAVEDRHALLCSADTAYFSSHTLLETATAFVKEGGQTLFIDEIHKYEGWSKEIKEIYDLYKNLHVVLSGSSLIQLNDGRADLSRRADVYEMPGLSFREYLWFRTGKLFEPISLDDLLTSPAKFCLEVKAVCHPLEYFKDYLERGYYPFSLDRPKTYKRLTENVVNYIVENDLVRFRGVTPGNTRKILALLQVVSSMVPYLVDVAKLSRSTSIDRLTLLKYLGYLNEAKIIRNLYTELDTISDLQKPDKILLDNPNLLYTYAWKVPEAGTVRETFFCNQLAGAGHKVEYRGIKTGDFRIDNDLIIEVGGAGKDFSQISNDDIANAALAVADLEVAIGKKIPLWCFGFLY